MREIRRLILWDLDGTLLSAGPVAREAFADAVAAVLGRDIGDHGVQMSGKTDPGIAMEVMLAVGVPEEEARRHLASVLKELERRLEGDKARMRAEGRAHPGILELLERLGRDPSVLQTVLTGNLRSNARLKLEAFGLEGYLDLEAGAYGSDHHLRNELIPIALRRVEEHHGVRLDPSDVWVVGDTPADLDCARAGGARCLLVATGRYGLEGLAGLDADALFETLADTDGVASILLS
jgi:phosphoglycolate phosphatase